MILSDPMGFNDPPNGIHWVYPLLKTLLSFASWKTLSVEKDDKDNDLPIKHGDFPGFC